MLAFPLIKKKFNAIMSVTYKFSNQVTFNPDPNTQSVKNWVHAFLKRIDLIDRGLPGELITDCNPKFLSFFRKALFIKLEVKLLYSIAYHLQTDGVSKQTNQTVKIVLQFFVNAINDSFCWPKVLPHIQSLFNNTSSSTIGKTFNKVAYKFLP